MYKLYNIHLLHETYLSQVISEELYPARKLRKSEPLYLLCGNAYIIQHLFKFHIVYDKIRV